MLVTKTCKLVLPPIGMQDDCLIDLHVCVHVCTIKSCVLASVHDAIQHDRQQIVVWQMAKP